MNRKARPTVERTCGLCSTKFWIAPSIVDKGKGNWCSRSCAHTAKADRKQPRPEVERFWERVNKAGPIVRAELGHCWIWTWRTNKRTRDNPDHGYGGFVLSDGSSIPAHHFSYIQANGPIPEGLWVLHHCDIKHCVRPSHLYVGTRHDNIRDAVVRLKTAHGEAHGMAKLTAEQVLSARRRVANGERQTPIAKELGVTLATLNGAIHKRTWSWL